jgi:hypothetical protein
MLLRAKGRGLKWIQFRTVGIDEELETRRRYRIAVRTQCNPTGRHYPRRTNSILRPARFLNDVSECPLESIALTTRYY